MQELGELWGAFGAFCFSSYIHMHATFLNQTVFPKRLGIFIFTQQKSHLCRPNDVRREGRDFGNKSMTERMMER